MQDLVRAERSISRRPTGKAGHMGSLGMQEIIVIFVLALIVFGPRKLPEIGKSLGKALSEFKKASNELRQSWEDEVRLDKEKEAVKDILKDSADTKESSATGTETKA